MTVDETARHELYQKLEPVLGSEAANALMAELPPVAWADLATKSDLVQLEDRLDARFQGLESNVDAKLAALESNVDAKLAGLESTVDAKLDGIRHEVVAIFRGELNTAITGQTRILILSFFATMLSTGSLVLAAARLV